MTSTRGGIIKCDIRRDGTGGVAVGIFNDVGCPSACFSLVGGDEGKGGFTRREIDVVSR